MKTCSLRKSWPVAVVCGVLLGWAPLSAQEAASDATPKGPSAIVMLADGSLIASHDLIFEHDGQVSARSEVGEFHWKWEEILSISLTDAEPRPSRFAALLIAGDERIHGQVAVATEENIELKSELFGQVSIPLSAVEGILLAERLAGSAKERLINRLRTLPRQGDAFLLANGDTLLGTASQLGPENWTIDVDGQPRTVETNRLQGVALDPRLLDYKKPDELLVVARFIDGSTLIGKDLVVSEGKCEMTSLVGPKLSFSWSGEAGSAAMRFDVRGGKARYLSEMTPQRQEIESFFDAPVEWKRDANADGEPIRIAGERHDRGIGMRTKMSLDFPVEGYDRFLSMIGIDESASGEASVIFRVLVDGKSIFESPAMSLTSPAIPVDLVIDEGKVLTLTVDFADRGDAGDLANWASARLVKSKK
ncbi:NPCBM/NEW2 domain-containing protein [bacterium]|nr:NPCBM/NEW2 domain-containing protein [bacterium]